MGDPHPRGPRSEKERMCAFSEMFTRSCVTGDLYKSRLHPGNSQRPAARPQSSRSTALGIDLVSIFRTMAGQFRANQAQNATLSLEITELGKFPSPYESCLLPPNRRSPSVIRATEHMRFFRELTLFLRKNRGQPIAVVIRTIDELIDHGRHDTLGR